MLFLSKYQITDNVLEFGKSRVFKALTKLNGYFGQFFRILSCELCSVC